MTATLDIFSSNPGAVFSVRVTPKARMERVVPERLDDGTFVFRVHVTAAPEDGKANKAVIALLARHLGVPKTALAIVRGEAGRNKTVRLQR